MPKAQPDNDENFRLNLKRKFGETFNDNDSCSDGDSSESNCTSGSEAS